MDPSDLQPSLFGQARDFPAYELYCAPRILDQSECREALPKPSSGDFRGAAFQSSPFCNGDES